MSTNLDNDEIEPEIVLSKDKFKASALKPGARVGLVAPSSRPESPLALRRCVQVVEEMGFEAVVGSSVMRYSGFTAGTDDERVDDLHSFLHDSSVEALLCVSGGYGAARLLPLLDFSLIRKQPKIFLGSGDNDALLLAINELTGLVVFHGQNLDEIDDKHTFESVKSILTGNCEEMSINCRDAEDASYEGVVYSFSDEICEGTTCGGNLTTLSSLFGTKYQPELNGKILLLDDFGERYDILDRWFTTLYLARTLNEVGAIAFGGFPGCAVRGSSNLLSIEDTFGDRIKELAVNACFGFKFGLGNKDNVVPIGVNARLDCGDGTMQILESPLASN